MRDLLRAARLARILGVAILPAAIVLAACGDDGGDDDDDVDMPQAFAVLGQPDFSSSEANRAQAVSALGLAQPLGGIGTNGTLFYLADNANNRVLGWNDIPDNGAVAADFALGQADFTSNDPATSSTAMALPAAVAVSANRLLVADSGNNRVLIWNTLPSANTPPDLVIGQTDFDDSEPGTAASQLSFPVAAMIALNRLFVVDQGNHRVLIWNSIPTASGQAADVVLGQPDFITAEAGDEEEGLTNPSGLWTDGIRLLVSDSGNNRVMYWTQVPRNNYAAASYVIGQTDFSRTSSGLTAQLVFTPYGIASDGTHIYVADSGNNRVLKFDSFPIGSGASAADVYGQEAFSSRVPNDDDQDGSADDTPSARTLSSPTGVTVFSGVLYIADRNNHRVLMFPD